MSRSVIIATHLPASPDRLFEMYLDPQQHEAFTGAPVTIEARSGAPFSAFEGILSGTMLHIQPKSMIVQTWRSGKWSDSDPDSILILVFRPDESGARIELSHINVPDSDFAGISEGWVKHYFDPWRAYLSGTGAT